MSNIVAQGQITIADLNDGVSYYTYIKYGDSLTPSTLYNTPTGHSYIGLYTGTATSPPTTYSSYTWSKYVGSNGTSESFKNATITYCRAKVGTGSEPTQIDTSIGSSGWQSSAPATNTNYPYLWTRVVLSFNNSSSISTSYSVSSTMDSIEIGGRNLFRKGWLTRYESFDEATNTYTIKGTSSIYATGFKDGSLVVPFGSWYVISMEVLSPINGTLGMDNNERSTGTIAYVGNDITDNRTDDMLIPQNVWTKFVYKASNTRSRAESQSIYVYDSFGIIELDSTQTFQVRNIKFELGNQATDWTPAPEDIDSAISSAQSAANAAQSTANKAVEKVDYEYVVAANSVTITSSNASNYTWSTTMPSSIATNNRAWMRPKYTYKDGTTAYGSPTLFNLANGLWVFANNVAADSYTVINGGAIKTGTVDTDQLAANSISAGKLKTDAIKSTNYTASSNLNSPYSALGTFLDLSTGNIYTPNFGVDSVSGAAYLNGTIYAADGKIGDYDNSDNYWSIGSTEDKDNNDLAYLKSVGKAYIQTGNWQLSNDSLNTQSYSATTNGITYPNTGSNYVDYGMHVPGLETYTGLFGTLNDSFLYIRKSKANSIPTLDADWNYLFRVDRDGKMNVSGLSVNGVDIATMISNGVEGGAYVSTSGGSITGNLSVSGTITGTLSGNASSATKATQDGNGNTITSTYHKLTGSNTNSATNTFSGDNTFSKTSGFNFSGIEAVNADASRSVWFAHSSKVGTPVYSNKFKYNPATDILTVGSITGAAAKATADASGNVITTTYAPINNATFTGVTTAPSLHSDDITAGNLLVNGAARFTNGLTGNLTGNADTATTAATATKAIKDGDGNIISSTYHKLTGTNTNSANNTFSGENIFSSSSGFNFSGIEPGTSDASRPVWFSWSGKNGTPVYDDDFKYNPASNLLTTGKIKLTSTDQVAHIDFGRPGWNYIRTPEGTDSCLAIVPNGGNLAGAPARLVVNSTSVFPGYNNGTIDLGISSYKWKTVYATTFSGNATSATKLTSSAGSATNPIYFNDGQPTACSYSLNKTVPSDAKFTDTTYSAGTGIKLSGTTFSINNAAIYPYESRLEWGGRNLSGSISPIDAACIDELGHNKLAFLPAECIDVEYTTDGGATWLDYGLSDSKKIAIVSTTGPSIKIGKGAAAANNGTLTADNCGNYKARITISTRDKTGTQRVCTYAKKLLLNYSSNGASGGSVLIETQSIDNYNKGNDVWDTLGTYNVIGWPEWNSFPFVITFGGNPTKIRQKAKLRITLSIAGISSPSYSACAEMLDVRMIGVANWSCPSEMARSGHLYRTDTGQNAEFPAQVKATQFNGSFNGNLTGDVSGNASTATASGTLINQGTLDTQEKIDGFIAGNRLKYAVFKTTEQNNIGMASNDGMLLSIPWTNANYGSQIAFDDTSAATVKVRGMSSGTWGDWKTIFTTANYNDYVPKRDGTGANGTWGISISGNASSASKLSNTAAIGSTSNPVYFSANGVPVATDYTFTTTAPSSSTASTDKTVPTSYAVWSAIQNGISTNAAMVFKGTIGSSGATITALPAKHDKGDTYVVSTAGTYAGVKCTPGDMVICVTAGSTANNAHWTVVHINTGAVTGPTSSTANHIATFSDTTGGSIKDSGYTIATSVPANAVFTDTNKYHKTGSWSGLTYTADAVGGADALAFTIPTGTTATTVAAGNHTHSYLPLSGGTITDSVYFNTGTNTKPVYITRKGTATESAAHGIDDSYYTIKYTNDKTSSTIRFQFVNTDTESGGGANASDRSYFLTSTGVFYPSSNNYGSIGSFNHKWNSVYATTIYGNLSGNASTATKATQDGNGNVITSTYATINNPTFTGVITAPSLSSDDITAGNLLVNGAARFTNGLTGTLTGNVVGNVSGNAGAATQLQNARNITVGDTTRTFNGTANISFSKDEIGMNYKNIQPLKSKTYTGVYSEQDNNTYGYKYYGSVKPTSYKALWHIKLRIKAYVPNQPDYYGQYVFDISGMRNTYSAYACWNNIQNDGYRPFYYHTFKFASSEANTLLYGHMLGMYLRSCTNYTNSSYARTYEIEVLEEENCTLTLFDNYLIYSNVTGTGNHNSATNFNAASYGLQESGDADNYAITQFTHQAITVGSELNLPRLGLFGLDREGKCLAFSNYQADYTSYNTSINVDRVYSTLGIDYTRGMYVHPSDYFAKNSTVYSGCNWLAVYSRLDFRYSDNNISTAGTTLSLVSYKPVYIRGVIKSDGLFYLRPIEVTYNNTIYKKVWTQDIPTTVEKDADGYQYAYWFVGYPYYSYSYYINLQDDHPMYWYHNGRFEKYNHHSESADALLGFSKNNSITWGSLSNSAYTYIHRMDTPSGGSVAFADKGGQTSMQIDGLYYQNEGNYRVLDTSDIYDGLDSTSATKVLSANQGYQLKNGDARDNTKLPLAGGTMTGTTILPENELGLHFRNTHPGYHSGVMYQTYGNEALVFANKQDVTSFMFLTGTDPTTMTFKTWPSANPALQIKKNSVYINKRIDNDVTPDYKLYANGDVQLNGKVGISEAVTMGYDSTNKCLNFVFS